MTPIQFNQIFVKDYGFFTFAKNIGRNICENISKILAVNIVKNVLIMLNILLQIHLKLLQKNSKSSQ